MQEKAPQIEGPPDSLVERLQQYEGQPQLGVRFNDGGNESFNTNELLGSLPSRHQAEMTGDFVKLFDDARNLDSPTAKQSQAEIGRLLNKDPKELIRTGFFENSLMIRQDRTKNTITINAYNDADEYEDDPGYHEQVLTARGPHAFIQEVSSAVELDRWEETDPDESGQYRYLQPA